MNATSQKTKTEIVVLCLLAATLTASILITAVEVIRGAQGMATSPDAVGISWILFVLCLGWYAAVRIEEE